MAVVYFWRGLFFLATLYVTYQTLTPNPEDVDGGLIIMKWLSSLLFSDTQYADKVTHFTVYGILGGLGVFAQFKAFNRQIFVPLALGVYGGVLEVIQAYGGVRSGEWADGLANLAGALLGFFVALVVISQWKRWSTTRRSPDAIL